MKSGKHTSGTSGKQVDAPAWYKPNNFWEANGYNDAELRSLRLTVTMIPDVISEANNYNANSQSWTPYHTYVKSKLHT